MTAMRANACRGVLLLGLPGVLAGQEAADSAPGSRIELVREVAIGANAESSEYQFARILYAAATRSGSVFAVDRPNDPIRKYDGQGRFAGTIGRIGSGPGEYRQAVGLATHGDSLLLVYDASNGRIVVFDTAGAFRRTVRITGGGFFGPKMFAVGADGLIAIRTMARGPGGEPIEGSTLPTLYIRHRLSGDVVDTIPVPPEPSSGFVLMTSDGPRWNFPERGVYTLLPRGGLATAQTSAYRIEVAPGRGSRFTIERPARPIRIEGRERDEWRAWADYFAARPNAGPAAAIPSHKPIIRDLLADAEGRIWVNLYAVATHRSIPPRPAGDRRPLLTMREHNLFDLFDERGRFLGRVELPPGSVVLVVTGDRVWLGEETDEGEYVLARYLLRGAATR